MSDKTYIFEPTGGSNLYSQLVPFLQNQGVDPNVLLAMNNNGMNGMGGGWFIWIIFIALLWGRGG